MSVDLEVQTDSAADDANDILQYRAMSAAAVTGCVFAALSVLTLLNILFAPLAVIGAIVSTLAYVRIRANPNELTGGRAAAAGMIGSIVLLAGGLGYHGVVYATEVPEGFERVSYQTLQPNQNNPGEIVPAAALELNGKPVFIKGYIYPQADSQDLKEFIIVRDNGDCCFGGQTPKLTDMIQVKLAPPLAVDYSTRLHSLAGTFYVRQGSGTGGLGLVVYHLDATYVK